MFQPAHVNLLQNGIMKLQIMFWCFGASEMFLSLLLSLTGGSVLLLMVVAKTSVLASS
jgi:hypothetical protein